MRIVLGLLTLVIVVPAYVALNVALARFGPKIWRIASVHLKRRWRRQLCSLSTSRIWVIASAQVTAMLLLFLLLDSEHSLLVVIAAMAGYVLVSGALCLSVLAQLPIVQALWRDPATRVLIWAMPVGIGFVSRGYAASWISDVIGVSAANTPYALLLATAMLASLSAFFLLGVTSLLFEVAMFFTPQAHGRLGRKVGLAVLAITSFLSALLGSQAAALPTTRLGGALISAVVFEFDAGPATPCKLEPHEAPLAQSDDVVRALYLASSQEKAVLIQREPALFRPFIYRHVTKSQLEEKRVRRLRTVTCFT
jgi:hypothetical protein